MELNYNIMDSEIIMKLLNEDERTKVSELWCKLGDLSEELDNLLSSITSKKNRNPNTQEFQILEADIEDALSFTDTCIDILNRYKL